MILDARPLAELERAGYVPVPPGNVLEVLITVGVPTRSAVHGTRARAIIVAPSWGVRLVVGFMDAGRGYNTGTLRLAVVALRQRARVTDDDVDAVLAAFQLGGAQAISQMFTTEPR